MEKDVETLIGLLIDCPNMIRVSFEEIFKVASGYGRVVFSEAFINKYAAPPLIESIFNAGYKPVNVSLQDVDTAMAVRATELVCSPRYHIDLIALATRDCDFLPAVFIAKEYRKKTLGIFKEGNGISCALRKSFDFTETLPEIGQRE